jgi:hypothetical protein
MSEPAYQYGDLWYIRLTDETSKFPKDSWGGYSQDFETAEHVYSHAEVVKSDWRFWGVVGIRDLDRVRRVLLIFDLDVHKAEDGDDTPRRIQIDDSVPLIKSQSGGFHAPYIVHGERGSADASGFQVTANLTWDVDIRGSAVKHHVVAPGDIPGVGGRYEIVKDGQIPTVFNPSEAINHITLDGDPVLKYRPGRGVGGDWSLDADRDPPEDIPRCYHAGLTLRAANPDDHPNTHKVNTLTALCGLAAGYTIEDMVGHFCEEYPPGVNADESETRYQLELLAKKMERGALAPPSPSTLRDWRILPEGETCKCGVRYHGDDRTTVDLIEGSRPPSSTEEARSLALRAALTAELPGNG